MTAAARTTLQGLIWPEPGLSTERELHMNLAHGAALSMQAQRVDFIPGGHASFGSYYNLFNCGKWYKYCDLENLELQIAGEGQFELVVFYAHPERSWERLVNEVVTLKPTAPLEISVVPPGGFETRGVLFFELTALSAGHLKDAVWQTTDRPRRTPDLMLSITTFQREAAVTRTVERFATFVRQSTIAPHLHLTVIDNGQSIEIAQTDTISVIPNANLGGSGGFARGLLEAMDRQASHCLFMDDDASVHMAAIERTWTFLAYARDPATTVAGAVSNAQHHWQVWENGALFDRVCQPQHIGLDLRDITSLLDMEFETTATAPFNLYGGWWYFAFPLQAVRHLPFPFFLRGDDVSFSLVHDFVTVTLPGVMSFQDEDFSVKETPLTVYLDLRSHLAHHLCLPKMEIGRRGILQIILRFYLRSLISCHYDTLDAIALALEDVSAGPTYFADNADLADRRADIGALTDMERWRAVDDPQNSSDSVWLSPHHLVPRLLMKATLNGHLLPGFLHIGNKITLSAATRGQVRPLWGAAKVSYVSVDGKRSYTVTHSKRRALSASRAIWSQAWKIWWRYDDLCSAWRTGYQDMTQMAFWNILLGEETPSKRSPADPPAS